MPANLFTCSACGRANSYMRDVCLHCGATLDKVTKQWPELLQNALSWFHCLVPPLQQFASRLWYTIQSNLHAAGIGVALLVGVVMGSQFGRSQSALDLLPTSTFNFQSHSSPLVSDYQFGDTGIDQLRDIEEMRLRLEDARDRAEEAVEAARDAAFEATMRWAESASTGDFMRMWSADDAVDRAEESLNAIEDALSQLE